MLRLLIRTRAGEYPAELDESDVSSAVWLLSSPKFSTEVNQISGMYYFELPVDPKVEGKSSKVFDKGDICWWPKVNAMVIFYDSTPLSGEDGRPAWKFPLVKIGHITGEFASLEEEGDRQRITLVQQI